MKDKLIFTTGVVVSLIVISVSGFLLYKKGDNQSLLLRDRVQVIAEITQTPRPTEKPQEIMNYINSEIEVLNASGKVGLAKTYAEKLEKLGYTKVKTANYEKTIIGNLLFAPGDFGKDIELSNYKFEVSKEIKIILGK